MVIKRNNRSRGQVDEFSGSLRMIRGAVPPCPDMITTAGLIRGRGFRAAAQHLTLGKSARMRHAATHNSIPTVEVLGIFDT